MPDDTKTWRWVQGDDNDPAERWLLVEGDGPLPGPRVILECGNIDAEDMARIAALPRLHAACRRLSDMWDKFMDDESCVNPLDYPLDVRTADVQAALDAARGEGEPDA
jgi:hypothetical protein